MPMGLIRWLKKEKNDSAFQHRRESAPAHTLQNFDANKTRDDKYNRAMYKFNEWRANERNKRASMDRSGRNNDHRFDDTATADDEDHDDDHGDYNLTQSSVPNQNRIPTVESSDMDDEVTMASVGGGRGFNRYCLNRTNEFFEPIQSSKQPPIYGGRIPRHSLPASTNKPSRRTKKPQIEPATIHEDEVKEFEAAHCYGNVDGNGTRTPFNSPPTKFYKQNSNPYAASSMSQHLFDGSCDASSTQVSSHRPCPEKPKRIMLKQQNASQLTKELSGAHFSGAYKDYVIRSPFYAAECDRAHEKPIGGSIRAAAIPSSSSNETGDERGVKSIRNRTSGHYQQIVNIHGDIVEYAVPLVEHHHASRSSGQFRAKLGDNPLQSDAPNYDDEIFVEDPRQIEEIIGRNVDSDDDDGDDDANQVILRRSNIPPASAAKSKVMVTDLDKSTDSSKSCGTKWKRHSKQMFCGVNSLPMATVAIQTHRNLLELFESIRGDVLLCLPNELKWKGILRNTFASPMEFCAGTFRATRVAMRKCSLTDSDDGSDDKRFIAESVLRRDLEIIRKIRHQDIISLMAISCDADSSEITFVLEPAEYTLHYFLHQMGEEVSVTDSISIVQQLASAVSYIHKCDFIHSNISSHAVLVKNRRTVKLTSFELTTCVSTHTKAKIERAYKRNSKVINAGDTDTVDGDDKVKRSPHSSNVGGSLKDRYRMATRARMLPMSVRYSTRTFRDMNVEFLPYCAEYRQQLTVLNYQPPELLVKGERFVYPLEVSDVYSLTLVLWELLNKCEPFAIYEPNELIEMYAANRARLPTLEEERCQEFKQIFKFGFAYDPINRSMPVLHMIQLLDDIKQTRPDYHPSHVEYENSLYSSAATKPVATVHEAAKNSATTKPTENVYENTVEPLASHVASKTQQSMNNVTNSTFHRSILDYQKMLSPLRATNANNYERARTSTLKKRKKQTPTKQSPSNVRDPFENTGIGGNTADHTMNFDDEFSPKLNENIPLNSGVALAATNQKPSMVRNLQYENGNATPKPAARQSIKTDKDTQSQIERWDVADANRTTKANNSSYQFSIEDYELPQHLIARNNKIRRNTWLSSDTVNNTTINSMAAAQGSPFKVVQSSSTSMQKTPPMNDSSKANKTLNVTLRIVTKQLTPPGSEKSDSSVVASNNSIDNVSIAEDSPSVLTRIQFFRSLENPGNFTTGNKSRRSEISFDEAVKQSTRRTQMKSLSAASPPLSKNNKRQLLKDINDIAEEISKCLNNNRFEQRKNASTKSTENNLHVGYVSPTYAVPKAIENDKGDWPSDKQQSKNNVSTLVQKLFGDEKEPSVDEVDDDAPNEKRNSVKETVQRIENVLQHLQTPPSHNVSVNSPIRKIENKLLNEKIFNTEAKSPVKVPPSPKMPSNTVRSSNSVARKEEMSEKVEEVMQIVGLSECENDAGQPTNTVATATTRSNHTVIKRTFYQESFISGTNVELPHLERMLDAQSPQKQSTMYTATKSSASTTKLTTQVTVNLRQFKRRLSDVGITGTGEDTQTTRLADVRHSVCGNEVFKLQTTKSLDGAIVADTTVARVDPQMTQRTNETLGSYAMTSSNSCNFNSDAYMSNVDLSTVRTQKTFNNRHMQSIEDLYIDDDFCPGMGLAANMKLITNSTDTLDGIDFDLISTRIVEQTSESMITSNLQQQCIGNGPNADQDKDDK